MLESYEETYEGYTPKMARYNPAPKPITMRSSQERTFKCVDVARYLGMPVTEGSEVEIESYGNGELIVIVVLETESE